MLRMSTRLRETDGKGGGGGWGERDIEREAKDRERKEKDGNEESDWEGEIRGKSVIKTAADLFTLCARHSN